MEKIEKLSAAAFPLAVRDGVVLVDFFARWHGPCHKQNDLLNSLIAEERLPSQVKITKLDIDEAPVIAAKFEVDIVPTLVIFQNGIEIGRLEGVADEEMVIQLFGKQ